MQIPFFIQWTQIDNMTCRQSVLAGSQDNWLITQYIGKTVGSVRLPQVNIQIEFDVSQCEDTAFQQALSLYTFETGGSENTTAVRDINNYHLVERLFFPNDSLNGTSDSEINFVTESDGFYLAFRDEGACIVLNRVVLSYNICPGETADLVIRPETIAPRIGIPSQEVRVRAECVPGASLENQDSAEILCLQRGEWASVPEFGCRCDPELRASEGGFSCKSTLLVLRKCINVPPPW